MTHPQPQLHITDRTRIKEIIAVLATVAGKFIFMDWLNVRLVFIVTIIIAWTGYVIYRSHKIEGILGYWGFRGDNFKKPHTIAVYVFAVLASVALIVTGYYRDTLCLQWHMIYVMMLYPIWGVIQQFLVIGIMAGNLRDMEKFRRVNSWVIIVVTAVLFGLVHIPWWWLVLCTFGLALFYGYIYLHEKNLWVLGLFHGVLGALAFYTVVGRDPWKEVFGPVLQNPEVLKSINIAGLAFDVVGASLMYFNTPFPSSKPRGTSGQDQINESAEYLFYGKGEERKKLRRVKLGFGLLLAGFVLQFFAEWFG